MPPRGVHLAELEAEFGDRAAAMARLEAILPKTQDSEPYGLLAELLADSNPKRAAELVSEAKKRYERLLENRPTQRARLVAIEAAHAAGNRAGVCRLVRGAPKTATSQLLADALPEHRAHCK